jgi:large subunit ribosomal protein L25
MADFTLDAAKRTDGGEDTVSGVVYGKEQESTSLTLDRVDLEKAYYNVGTSKVFDLKVEGTKKPIKVLFHEIQTNPVNGDFTHVDFYAVMLGQKLRTEVPLHFEGTPKAVVNAVGDFITVRDTIEVEATPLDLPERYDINVEGLEEIGDSIHVYDLKVDEKVEILVDKDSMIAQIVEQRETPEEEEELPDEFEEPELIGEDEEGSDDEGDDQASTEAEDASDQG